MAGARPGGKGAEKPRLGATPGSGCGLPPRPSHRSGRGGGVEGRMRGGRRAVPLAFRPLLAAWTTPARVANLEVSGEVTLCA